MLKLLQHNAARSRGAALRLLSFRAWDGAPMAPADPILGLTQDFLADTHPKKVSLGVGAYRDGNGKPAASRKRLVWPSRVFATKYVLPSVRTAEERVLAGKPDHEYAPIVGDAEFVKASLQFAYGADCAPLKEGLIVGVQTLSGTGACAVVGKLLHQFAKTKVIYVPDPTWGNHINIFRDMGIEVRKYRYLDAKTKTTLDFEGMAQDLEGAEAGACVLLHACAHNPTGVDPTAQQWAELSKRLMKTDKLQLFFDCAYQGFASGDAETDAAALRLFVADGHKIILAQSYAKNFGLYGERVGALSAVCASKDDAKILESQLKALIRPMYSSPPVYGARVVKAILNDDKLRAQWTEECLAMAVRIKEMRSALRSHLEGLGSQRSWAHITDQIGMFAYTGLTSDQVKQMRADYHVYCTLDGAAPRKGRGPLFRSHTGPYIWPSTFLRGSSSKGRISVAGLNAGNVEYVATAIHAVSK